MFWCFVLFFSVVHVEVQWEAGRSFPFTETAHTCTCSRLAANSLALHSPGSQLATINHQCHCQMYLQLPCEVNKLPCTLLPALLSTFGSTLYKGNKAILVQTKRKNKKTHLVILLCLDVQFYEGVYVYIYCALPTKFQLHTMKNTHNQH